MLKISWYTFCLSFFFACYIHHCFVTITKISERSHLGGKKVYFYLTVWIFKFQDPHSSGVWWRLTVMGQVWRNDHMVSQGQRHREHTVHPPCVIMPS